MERRLALAQHAIDAFADRCGLALALLDAEGREAARSTRDDPWARMAREEGDRERSWLGRLDEVGVFDACPGLGVIVAPVRVNGEATHYLWAGAFTEPETREFFRAYAESRADAYEGWRSDFERLRTVSAEEKRGLIERMSAAADTVGALLEREADEATRRSVAAEWKRATERLGDERSLRELLQTYLEMSAELDFVGYAERSGDGGCVVTAVVGDAAYAGLAGASFAVGEGFMGQTFATGLPGGWNGIRHDSRNVFFLKRGIPTSALACYPVTLGERAAGVLFCGACRKPALDSRTIDAGQVLANVVRASVRIRALEHSGAQQLQRLQAVTDICRWIARVRDPKKIAFMLVDMSLHIMRGSFAALALFDRAASDEVRVLSRGLTEEQSESYGKRVLREYRSAPRQDAVSVASASAEAAAPKPIVRTLEWGAEAIEMPIVSGGLLGVLGVAFDARDEEAASFLSTLSTIGAIALQQSAASPDDGARGAELLHEAAVRWDPAAYERAKAGRSIAVSFAAYLGLPEEESRAIEYACLLSPYPSDFLKRALPSVGSAIDIVAGCEALEAGRPDAPAPQGAFVAKLALAAAADGALVDPPPGVPPSLLASYRAFALRAHTVDRHVTEKDASTVPLEGLSNRESEVLHLIVDGLNNKQIAAKLYISEHTVKNHITKIFQKLGIGDRAGVMAYFYQQKWKPH